MKEEHVRIQISYALAQKLQEISQEPLTRGYESAIWKIILKLDPSTDIPPKYQYLLKKNDSQGRTIPESLISSDLVTTRRDGVS